MIVTFGLVSLQAGNAAAQGLHSEPGALGSGVQALAGDEFDPALSYAPEWGTTDFYMFQLPAAEFTTKDSDTIQEYWAPGYISRSAGGSQFWAPVVLPAGANLHGMRFFYYDNSASDITVFFTRYYGDAAPVTDDMVNWTSSGTPTYSSNYVTIGHTITYDDPTDGEQAYVVIVMVPTTDGSLRFKGVRLLYYLQISPAPAVASFNDVGSGYWAFQAIEALAASGITTGFPDGTFRPENTVSRAQMATFLARALGLHYPK